MSKAPLLLCPTRSGALDAYTTGLKGAYGITLQLSAWAGSAIRVRKSTGGDTTTEQDIGLVGTTLDTTALATFAGSETVVVTKLYDQSGNGFDLVQATGASQPRIVNAGVYDGFIRFDGTNDWLQTSGNGGAPTHLSVSMKANFRSSAAVQVFYVSGVQGQAYCPASSNIACYTDSTGGNTVNYQASLTYPSTTKVFGFHHDANATDGAASQVWFNGTQQSTSALGAGTTTGAFVASALSLGASTGGGAYASSDVYSFAYWEANQGANMAGIATAMA